MEIENHQTSQLQNSMNFLHILYHRNRNQHRRGSFWKWFSMLKRCIGKLIIELSMDDSNRSQARILYMKDTLLPRCHLWVPRTVGISSKNM